MFGKNRYNDEDKGLSEPVKALIGLLLIIGMFIAAVKIGDWATEQDMKFQYGEIEKVR